MSSVEARGRTVEEAVRAALEKLGLEEDEVRVEVLEEPSRGFLGFIGSKEAVVRVTPALKKDRYVSKLLNEIFDAVGISVRMERRSGNGYVTFDVYGEGAEMFIGRRGEALDALQFLVNVAASQKSDDQVKIVVDIEGYRQRRRKRLEEIALKAAERVRRTGEKVVLDPMCAADRRIVHVTLQGRGDVTTYSEGEEPYRRVVVARKH